MAFVTFKNNLAHCNSWSNLTSFITLREIFTTMYFFDIINCACSSFVFSQAHISHVWKHYKIIFYVFCNGVIVVEIKVMRSIIEVHHF